MRKKPLILVYHVMGSKVPSKDSHKQKELIRDLVLSSAHLLIHLVESQSSCVDVENSLRTLTDPSGPIDRSGYNIEDIGAEHEQKKILHLEEEEQNEYTTVLKYQTYSNFTQNEFILASILNNSSQDQDTDGSVYSPNMDAGAFQPDKFEDDPIIKKILLDYEMKCESKKNEMLQRFNEMSAMISEEFEAAVYDSFSHLIFSYANFIHKKKMPY